MGKILAGGHEEQVLVEGKAGGTITPGDLVKWSAAGTLLRHATAGGNAQPMFALDFLEGNKGIDDDYATNSRLQAVIARRGTLIHNARVAAGAAAIAFGDALQSAGDGTVEKHTPQAVDEGGSATFTSYVNAIVGYALEAVDNSGGGAAVRIKLEVA